MMFGPIFNVLDSVACTEICVDIAHKQRVCNELTRNVNPLP